MSSFGLTEQGFNRKRYGDIKLEIETMYKSAYGDDFNLNPESPEGQIIAAWSDILAAHWESMEALYHQFNPNAAKDKALSELVQINGIKRIDSQPTTAKVLMTGSAGVFIPQGSLVSASSSSLMFETTEDLTLVDSPDSTQNRVNVKALDDGPLVVAAGEIDTVETGITNWSSVTNETDAVTGRNQETDAELRLRRSQSVSTSGLAQTDSIRGSLLLVNGVSFVNLIDNSSSITDPATNTPPHAIQPVVRGGLDSDVALAIFQKLPLGIASYGTTNVEIIDSNGIAHNIGFTRPNNVPIYIDLEYSVVGDTVAIDENQMIENIKNYGESSFGVGDDIIRTLLFTPINQTAGISIGALFIDKTANPVSADNISIAYDEIASWDVNNILVTEV